MQWGESGFCGVRCRAHILDSDRRAAGSRDGDEDGEVRGVRSSGPSILETFVLLCASDYIVASPRVRQLADLVARMCSPTLLIQSVDKQSQLQPTEPPQVVHPIPHTVVAQGDLLTSFLSGNSIAEIKQLTALAAPYLHLSPTDMYSTVPASARAVTRAMAQSRLVNEALAVPASMLQPAFKDKVCLVPSCLGRERVGGDEENPGGCQVCCLVALCLRL